MIIDYHQNRGIADAIPITTEPSTIPILLIDSLY